LETRVIDGLYARGDLWPGADDATNTWIKEAAAGMTSGFFASIRLPE
jgi:hypothetical protein